MKTQISLAITAIGLFSSQIARAQGTVVWDQQATNLVDGSIPLTSQPMGEAFTPSQSSMDVAAFNLSNLSGNPVNFEVNLLSGSITGTVLGTSMPITVPNDGVGVYDFFFTDPIPLTSGTEYVLQLSSSTGGNVYANIVDDPSLNGGEIYDGVLHKGFNFWFQEGIVVPEPSLTALFLLGSGLFIYVQKRKAESLRE